MDHRRSKALKIGLLLFLLLMAARAVPINAAMPVAQATTLPSTPMPSAGTPVATKAPPLPGINLTWYGQAMFKLQVANGPTILMDPVAGTMGYKVTPMEGIDVVTVSHEHADHNNVALAKGSPKILRGLANNDWAKVDETVKGVRIRSIPVYHDDTQGSARGKNAVFAFEANGLRIVHLGDLGHQLSADQVAAIGPVDILMIPVGGLYTIDAAGATKVVDALKPKAVIPMHYKTPPLQLGLAPVDAFVLGKSYQMLTDNQITFSSALLPKNTTIYQLGYEAPAAPVTFTWYGQSMFTIKVTNGPTIMMDPVAAPIGYKVSPLGGVDVVTVSHEHQDHNAVTLASGNPKILRGLANNDWAKVDETIKGAHITNVNAYHDDQEGKARGKDSIFIVEANGLRIVHLGDLGIQLSKEQVTAIGQVDVLIIPVGGGPTIDAAGANQVIEALKPRAIVPMHYKTPAISINLAPVDAFLAGKTVQQVIGNQFTLTNVTLPKNPTVILPGYEAAQPVKATKPGVDLTWSGQSMFTLKVANGPTVVMDPVTSTMGYKLSPISGVDAVTVSHEHGDHNNVAIASGTPKILRALANNDWAKIDETIKGVRIRSVNTFHDDSQGSARGKNGVFVFEANGLRIAHLGDLGHQLSAEQLSAIGPVDVVIVPVGGFYTVDAAGATKVVDALKPKVVIPMHYKTPVVMNAFLPVDNFLVGKTYQVVSGNQLSLSSDTLPKTTTVFVLGYEPAAPALTLGKVTVASGTYTNVSASDLKAMLDKKDFFFVNVHIPYAGEIAKTDAFIPFDQIEKNVDKLPKDKGAKIVIYCRSGQMATQAAESLLKMGYTNLYNLAGGMNEWVNQKYELLNLPQKPAATVGKKVAVAGGSYTEITPADLKAMLDKKDFFLVNVMSADIGLVPNTDAVIPTDQIESSTAKFPQDKGSKIVVYCQSGMMGTKAAGILVKLGYTNVYNMAGGMGAWKNEKYPVATSLK